MIIIEIDTINEAFKEDNIELARILRALADKINNTIQLNDITYLYDINGNKVGKIEYHRG